MLPIDMPVFHESKDIDMKTFFGFIRCKVWTNPDMIPLHGYKNEGKLTFAHH